MRRLFSSSIFIGLLTILSVTAVVAQGTCEQLVQDALEEVDVHCSATDRNEACYGYNRVEASFLSNVADDFFSNPADRADIIDIETIATTALNEDSGTWGVAIMKIQANIPNTIPGQAVTFVLMGDTEVENAVGEADTFHPSDGIEVQVGSAQGANIRSGPGLNYNVVGGAGANATLLADGLSQDSQWLRVVYRDRPAWVSRTVLEEDGAIDDLPVLTAGLRTPMQAFYLRTGLGEPECEAAPDDMLLIQGPDNLEIEFSVNGANISIGSTIGLRIVLIDGMQYLEVIVFDGHAEVGGVTIYPGYHSFMCLGEPDNRGLDGDANDRIVTCDPTPPERVPDFGGTWCILEDIPGDLLNYNIDILCPGETPPPTSSAGGGGGATQSQLDGVDCSAFRLIGPFSGITPRETTFEWTQAPGATRYEIVFYNYLGDVAQTFSTANTSITLNVGEIPTGSELQWEVRAYGGPNGDQYACVTGRTAKIFREADPYGQPPAGPAFGVWLASCTKDLRGYHATIGWQNLADGETITGIYSGRGESDSSSSSRPNGSMTLNLSPTSGGGNVSASTSDGKNASLGSC